MTARRDWANLFTRYRGKTLTEISRAEGVTKSAVCQAAKRHGRTYRKGPYKRPSRDWADFFAEHGHLSTADLAKMTGLTQNYMYQLKKVHTV